MHMLKTESKYDPVEQFAWTQLPLTALKPLSQIKHV